MSFDDFLCLSARQASRSAEDRYAASYAAAHSSVFPANVTSMASFAQMDELHVCVDPSEAVAALEEGA